MGLSAGQTLRLCNRVDFPLRWASGTLCGFGQNSEVKWVPPATQADPSSPRKQQAWGPGTVVGAAALAS